MQSTGAASCCNRSLYSFNDVVTSAAGGGSTADSSALEMPEDRRRIGGGLPEDCRRIAGGLLGDRGALADSCPGGVFSARSVLIFPISARQRNVAGGRVNQSGGMLRAGRLEDE